MKWIPLIERKPDWTIATTYEYFTDGKEIWNQDSIPDKATHWLEFELPPLPDPEFKDIDFKKLKNQCHPVSTHGKVLFELIEFLEKKFGEK